MKGIYWYNSLNTLDLPCDVLVFSCTLSPSDIDECLTPGICMNGRCINNEGSFRCECPPGLAVDVDGRVCVDTHMRTTCYAEFQAVCSGGIGITTDGRACSRGFARMKGLVCEDTRSEQCYKKWHEDECGEPLPGRYRVDMCCCSVGAAWGVDCEECPKEGMPEFNTICPRDIDECRISPDLCGHGTCVNTPGSFECECFEGYESGFMMMKNCMGYVLSNDASVCEDMDECADNVNLCENGQCLNAPGVYRCECEMGFTPTEDSKACEDMRKSVCYRNFNDTCENELSFNMTKKMCCCAYNVGKAWNKPCEPCPTPATTAFNTLCPYGHGALPGLGDTREDNRKGFCYTEVLKTMCQQSSTNRNTVTKSECCCNAGRGWGSQCELCPLPGTVQYKKMCPLGPGYTTDGRDLDECSTKQHNCQFLCVNTIGGFSCKCPAGFTQHQTACIDNNECTGQNSVCGSRASCVNTPGSFNCECSKGFSLDTTGLECEGFPGQLGDGDEDDSLSPEACYECKINGGGKNGRHRRSPDENELNQEPAVSMASVDTQTSIPMNLSLASLLNKEPLLELLPALEPLEHHVRYIITHGNTDEHFRLVERRDGKSVLRLGKRLPPPGSYRLEITSLPMFGPRRLHQLEEQHDYDYLQGEIGDALRIKLNIHLH
ncbi:hypothetical protein XENOCAPTIV_002402 [Xenoophorus captivus]|uniref:Fibrillin 2b n=1 Tax=Xenoophorus captivus TaxID=1517983 RepID=A0ABV0QCN3_9TELE